MANFNVDTNGNLWIGTNVSDTFSTAQGQSATNFYVTSAGSIFAKDGTIGGIDINTSDIQANYSSGTSGFKIDTNGDAEFNSVDIRIEQANSDTPSTGFTTLDIGSTQIYENNDDLYINTSGTNNFVKIRDRLILTPTSTSASNMQLMFDGPGSGDAMGFWHDTDWPNSDNAELYWTNQSGSGDYNKIAYVTTTDDYFHLGSDAPGIKTDFTGSPTFYFDGPGSPGTDSATFNMAVRPYAIKDKDGQVGSSGQVLSSTGSRIDWIDLPSGNDHPDSDHSFAATSHSHTESDISDIGSHGHSYDNYSYWRPRINGSNISGTIGSTDSLNFVAGSNMTISESGSGGTRNITFTASGGSGATTTSSSLDTSTTSGAGYFARHMSISGSTLTYFRSAKGSNLYVLAPRPTSNNSSSVGISTIQYNEVHARYGYFDFLTGMNTSSRDVKTDITDLEIGLNFINTLQPVKYKYVPQLKQDDGKYGWGFIAEDVETTLSNVGESNSKFYEEGKTDYETYGRCAHEFICTCDDPECCPEPITEVDTETGEVTETGCMKDNSCMQPCCTDIAGSTIDGKNYVHASEEECEQVFIDGRKHASLKKEELVAPLVKAVQELSTQISDLNARVEALEG